MNKYKDGKKFSYDLNIAGGDKLTFDNLTALQTLNQNI